MINVSTTCPCCGGENIVSMTEKQHNEYTAGYKNIQLIFPEWSPADRELLITGICGNCWKNIFGL